MTWNMICWLVRSRVHLGSRQGRWVRRWYNSWWSLSLNSWWSLGSNLLLSLWELLNSVGRAQSVWMHSLCLKVWQGMTPRRHLSSLSRWPEGSPSIWHSTPQLGSWLVFELGWQAQSLTVVSCPAQSVQNLDSHRRLWLQWYSRTQWPNKLDPWWRRFELS